MTNYLVESLEDDLRKANVRLKIQDAIIDDLRLQSCKNEAYTRYTAVLRKADRLARDNEFLMEKLKTAGTIDYEKSLEEEKKEFWRKADELKLNYERKERELKRKEREMREETWKLRSKYHDENMKYFNKNWDLRETNHELWQKLQKQKLGEVVETKVCEDVENIIGDYLNMLE